MEAFKKSMSIPQESGNLTSIFTTSKNIIAVIDKNRTLVLNINHRSSSTLSLDTNLFIYWQERGAPGIISVFLVFSAN